MNGLCEKFYEMKSITKQMFIEDFFNEVDLDSINETELKKFLRVVFEEEKDDYLRKLVMEIGFNLVLVSKINKHFILDLLLSIDNLEEPIIIQTSIKLLTYFCDENEEIILKIQSFNVHNDPEVAAEAYFRLGQLTLFKASQDYLLDEFVSEIIRAKELFAISMGLIENRTDAEFYYHLSEFICSFIQKDCLKMENAFSILVDDLWIRRLNHFDGKKLALEYKLYKILDDIKAIDDNTSNIEGWTNFSLEFTKLAHFHCDVVNLEILNNHIYQKYLGLFKDKITNHLLNPYYKQNYFPQKIRIDNLLNDKDLQVSRETCIILQYLKDIIAEQSNKKKQPDKIPELNIEICTKLQEIFPNKGIKQIFDDIRDLKRPENSYEVLELALRYNEETYKRSSEIYTGYPAGNEVFINIRNDIRTLLPNYSTSKFDVFSNLLEYVISYSYQTICSNKDEFLFLYNETNGGKGASALEKDLQIDLYKYLRKTRIGHCIYCEEKDFAEGGRVDVVFHDSGITFPIELKRTYNEITKENIRKYYLAQTQTYIYPYDQLGIFMLLDLTNKLKRPASSNNFRELFYIDHLKPLYSLDNKNPDYIVVAIIQGNRILPSKKSKYSK